MIHKQTQIYKLQHNIKARQCKLHLPPCKDQCTNLVIWSIICRSIIHHHPNNDKNYIITSKLHCVRKIVISLVINVLPGQPIEPIPWLYIAQEIPTQKYLNDITSDQSVYNNHYIEANSLKAPSRKTCQLAKTHGTHFNYPNFHEIRQYGIFIIPLSGKLNVIPHRYIT